MDDFLKMDIFFAVTTVSIVVLTILLSLVFIRLLRILQNLEDISALVEEEGRKLQGDLDEVRENVRKESVRIGKMLGFLTGARPRRRKKADTE